MTILTFPNDYTTRYQYDTGNPLTIQFVRSDLSPYDLTNVVKANMTKRILNMISNNATDGQGSWSTVNDLQGIAQYNWHANDVANIGLIKFQTTIPFPAGAITFKYIEVTFLSRI